MKTPRDKYQSDNQFRHLVDYLVSMIELNQFAPSEIREAALFASIKHQMIYGPKLYIFPDEVIRWLDTPNKD